MAGKVILSILICLLSVAVFAQDDNTKAEKKVQRIIPIKMLDEPAVINQRDVKHWGNGQTATPTGRQATGIGSGYSALRKNEPVKVINTSASLKATKRSVKENREIKLWPDGQKATVTGHEATPINGGYSALGRKKETGNKK